MRSIAANLIGAAFWIAVSVILVLTARALLRRNLKPAEGSTVAEIVMEPLAGIYGLLLAILVGAAVDRAMVRLHGLQTEAEAFYRIEQLADQLPAQDAQQLNELLQRYAKAEVAARVNRQSQSQSVKLLNDTRIFIATYESTRPSHGLLQSEALEDLRILIEQRPIAARAFASAVGPMIWMVLGIGAVCVIGTCVLAGLRDPHAPIYLTALTAVNTVTLYVLYLLSRPLKAIPFTTLADLIRT